jgi:hypothetical protein
MVVIPKNLLVAHGHAVLGPNEGEEILGFELDVYLLGVVGSGEGVGVPKQSPLGGRPAGLYFGEYVEMLKVASVTEPFLMLLH